MNLELLAIGTAVPEFSIAQEEAAQYAESAFCHGDQERRILSVLYRKSGVRRRSSVLVEPNGGGVATQTFFRPPLDADDRGPSVAERMGVYEREAGPLALRAAASALEQSGLDPGEISHLVTVSCSGFFAPGIDTSLTKSLSLRPTVERTHVGFMGCHGAMNGLRVARGFAGADPNARVLLCAVELCSLHYHYGWNPEQIVANAIFADGAAALVGAGCEAGAENGTWHAAASGSCILPDSEDAMTWRIGDHGFEMSLSARVPDLIQTHLKDWLAQWLRRNGLGLDEVRTWAVHPGGMRILSAVEGALGLPKEALAVSRGVLSEHGNMSSPTILFILDRLRRADAPRPCVALGFGPGLGAEAALFL